ncbi:MAG: hypothetical protein HZB38_04320 [Planctomycetes bacterium]|nr:hypothetical protein [Planctomycetota bacterium]
MALEPLGTAEGSEFPLVRQISVFLDNRLGQLLRLTKLFDASEIHILAISVDGSIDCAIVRIIVDDPDEASRMLREARFPVSETDLLVVELPSGKRGMMAVCAALISGEININYTYPLLPGTNRGACIAIQVDNLPQAAAILTDKKFRVLDQSQLSD